MSIATNILAKLFPDPDGNETFVSDLTNELELVNQSLWEVANMLSVKDLIKVAQDPREGGDAGTSIGVDEKVLLVLRDDIGCKEISVEDAFRAKDPESIHYATARSPVFWITKHSTEAYPFVYGFPTGWTKLNIFTYRKETLANLTGAVFAYIPPTAYEAVYLMSAMKIMQQKLSYMANDEEDAELYAIFQGNLQQIESALRDAIKMLTPGEGQREREK